MPKDFFYNPRATACFSRRVQDGSVVHDPVQVMPAGAPDKVLGVIAHVIVPDNVVNGHGLIAVEDVEHVLIREYQLLFRAH